MESFNTRLIACRKYKHLSQKDMALILSCSTRALQLYEKGEQKPGFNVLHGYYNQGFNVHWILNGEGEMLANSQTSDIDKELLGKIISLVEGELANSEYNIPPHRKSTVYFQLHDEIRQSGMKFEDKIPEIISLFNALSKF